MIYLMKGVFIGVGSFFFFFWGGGGGAPQQ